MEKSQKKLLFKFVVAAGAGIVSYWLVSIFVLSSFNVVKVEIQSEVDTYAKLYYSTSSEGVGFNEKKASQKVFLPGGVRTTLKFVVNNAVVKSLRVDPGTKPGTYLLYKMGLYSFFGDSVILGPEYPGTKLNYGDSVITQEDQFFTISTAGSDPYIIFQNVPKAENKIIQFLVPILVGLFAYISFHNFHFRSSHAWLDTFNKKPSSGVNYQALDGLRGLAAIFILASHAGLPGCRGLGMVGVTVFFVLSGLLLAMPYAKDSSSIMSRGHIKAFFLRRAKRIVPMFYFYIAVAYLFHDRLGDFVRSALFLQGQHILWTVLQEVHFYLLLPFLLLVTHSIFRGNNILSFIFVCLLSVGYCSNLIPTHTMYGNGGPQPLHAGLFLAGMTIAYAFQIRAFAKSETMRKILGHPLVSMLLLACLLGASLIGSVLNGMKPQDPTWVLRGYYCYAVAFLILQLLMANSSLSAKLLSCTPLRFIGTISYSFYLLHPVCLTIIKDALGLYTGSNIGNVSIFVVTLIFTCGFSMITYSLIERPFIRKSAPVIARKGPDGLSA